MIGLNPPVSFRGSKQEQVNKVSGGEREVPNNSEASTTGKNKHLKHISFVIKYQLIYFSVRDSKKGTRGFPASYNTETSKCHHIFNKALVKDYVRN